MKTQANCPHCDNALDKMPTRKKMCPHCQNFIFVREGKLVTEKEAKTIDEEKRALSWLGVFNVLQKDYDSTKEQLKKQFGHEPRPNDVIWRIANEQIGKIKDPEALSRNYQNMAMLLNEERKDTFHLLQLARKYELESLKSRGFKRVKIYPSYQCCPTCLENKDKEMAIEDAERDMILPVKNCSCIGVDPNRGFCRCSYEPCYNFSRDQSITIEPPKIEATKKDQKNSGGCLIAGFTLFLLVLLALILIL